MSVRPRKPAQVSLSKVAAYDTILRPIITAVMIGRRMVS